MFWSHATKQPVFYMSNTAFSLHLPSEGAKAHYTSNVISPLTWQTGITKPLLSAGRPGEVPWLPRATVSQDLNWKPNPHGFYSPVPLSPLSTDHVCAYATLAFKYLRLNRGSVLFSTWSYGEKKLAQKDAKTICFAETWGSWGRPVLGL